MDCLYAQTFGRLRKKSKWPTLQYWNIIGMLSPRRVVQSGFDQHVTPYDESSHPTNAPQKAKQHPLSVIPHASTTRRDRELAC